MNKHKKLYIIMASSMILSIILFAISPIFIETHNVWYPMLITGCLMGILLVLTLVIYIKYVKFVCPKCNQTFKPSNSAIIWAMHTPTKRRLKCPHCDAKSWCKEKFD